MKDAESSASPFSIVKWKLSCLSRGTAPIARYGIDRYAAADFYVQRRRWLRGARLLDPAFFDDVLTPPPVKTFWFTIVIAGYICLKLVDSTVLALQITLKGKLLKRITILIRPIKGIRTNYPANPCFSWILLDSV